MTNKLSIASYNLLHPEYAVNHPVAFLPDQGKVWASREAVILGNIQQSGADIICVQECSKTAFDSLKSQLKIDGAYAQHRTPKSDGVGVLFNPARFQRLDTRTLYDDQGTDLTTLFVDLLDLSTNKVIRVASAHIKGGPIRIPGDDQLTKALTRFETHTNPRPVDIFVVAGDLNQDQRSGPTSRLRLLNKYTLATSNQETEIGTGRQIDWIAARSGLSFNLAYEKTSHFKSGSDHHMLLASLTLMQTAAPPVPMTMTDNPTAVRRALPERSTCWNQIARCLGIKDKQA